MKWIQDIFVIFLGTVEGAGEVEPSLRKQEPLRGGRAFKVESYIWGYGGHI